MSGVSSMVTYARPEKFRKSIHHKWIGTVINSHIPDVAIICGNIVDSSLIMRVNVRFPLTMTLFP